MACGNRHFVNDSAFFVALVIIFSFTTHQATAHHPLFPGKPGWSIPSLHNPFPIYQEPVVPPHFLPLLPFPGMPTMPTLPSMPSMPAVPSEPSGPNFSSLPSDTTVPSEPSGPNFSSLPSEISVPAFPSLPSGPAFPSTPPPPATTMTSGNIPPVFPEPSAKLIENSPGTRTSP